MKMEKGFVEAWFLILIIWAIAVGGWIANIVKLIGMLDGGVTAMFVARVAGVFIAPFGSILGFF